MVSMDIRDYASEERHRQPEKEIQAATVKALRLEGYLVHEFAKPGSMRRCPHCGEYSGKGIGGSVPVGLPDLRIEDLNTWLEVKCPEKDPTQVQREMHEKIRGHGGTVYVVHSVEEAEEATRYML